MITLKLWNSLTSESRKEIARAIYGEQYNMFSWIASVVKEPYKHNFDYDRTGMNLKKLLGFCNLQKDGIINVTVPVTPKYAPKETAKPKAAKTSTLKQPKQFYAEKLNSYASGCANIKMALIQYGDKKIVGESQWNYYIDELYYYKKVDEVIVSFYWQGDHTDGCESAKLSEIVRSIDRRGYYLIPAEMEEYRGHTRYRRGDIKVTREVIEDAFKKVAAKL